MAREPIFQRLPAARLREIANYLHWDPFVAESGKNLSLLAAADQLAILEANRNQIED